MFLFAKARIATGNEGVLPFPRDLHKISILEARPEKNIDESRGPDDESLLLKPALLALTYTVAHHKGGIVIFTARSDFAVASRILSPFHPPRSPSYIFDPPATSQFLSRLVPINDLLGSPSVRFPRFLPRCFASHLGGLVID